MPASAQNMKRLKMRVFLVVICLALPIRAPASSSNALKRYQSGKYESALREYKRLLIENPDDPRLHFNAGAAAFQVEDFEEAQKQLNSALVTQDLQLQERAYYNLGNTEYRLGAAAQAPDKKQAGWEQAVASYESALKLNPKDDDAKFNLELVKEKIEELRKQQQQQSKEDKKDQKDQKDESKQDEQSKEEQRKQQEEKKSQQQKQQPDQSQEDKKPEENQAEQKPDTAKDDKAEAKKGNESKENKPEKPEDQQGEARRGVIAQMTPQQAQQLLDAQKAHEKAMIFIPKTKTNRVDRVFKDW